jgi:protein involved in polysaccharide export with SLBB domain
MKETIRFVIIFVLLTATAVHSQVSQTTDKSSLTSQQFQLSSANKSSVNVDASQLLSELNAPMQNFNSVPVEGVVNSDKYIVGQGDIFTLGLYGFLNQLIPLTVSIEGTIIIPSVGEIKVSDLTLSQAKEKVIAAVKKRYYSSNVSFTLSQPRAFLIPVTGLTQGTYTVTSLTRTSQLLSVIVFDTLNAQKRMDYKKINESMSFSFRNIELKRKDGSVVTVDIYKYFNTKDDKYNPTLREGDLLKIPYTNLNTSCLTVYGAVQIPGHYEYNKNDDLETVIGLGRGFDANSNPDSILVFRTSEDSKSFTTYNLSYDKDKNFKIEVFDRIFVKYKSDFRKMVSVQIQGEILRPGTYPITFKNTKLKDAIEMAGGMTKNAYLPLCIIFRTYDEEYLKRDTMELMVNRRANDLIVSEKDKLNFEEDVRGRRNRVVVDFEKLFKENDESQNIILEDKDLIYINDNKNSIYVYGQVQAEGYVPFKEGEDYEYYIEKAGGYSLAADKGNVRIIKFNSRGWYKPDEIKLNSGDFIYIPKKTANTFAETVTVISQIASVILGILTTYILIKNTQ